MNVLKVVLACLHVFTSLSATGTSFEAEGEWVYIGKSVRLISFVMDTDFPGEKKSWSPGHRSGYILLDEQSFTLSSASPFDSYYFRYEKGVLARTKVSDLGVSDTETKTSKIEMDYRAALLASLDECVIQGLGNVVKEILTKNSDKAPSRLVEMTRLRATAEFGGSWQALTRVTWLLPSPDGGDSTTRVVCKFSLHIPDHVELQYRGSHSELGERACASKYLLAESLGSLVKEISAGASLGGLVQLTRYGTLLPTSEEPSIPFIYVAAYGYYNDTADRDYVRARELYKSLGRWFRSDPIWPNARSYAYAFGSPTLLADPSGRSPCFNVDKDCAKWGSPFSGYEGIARTACDKLVKCLRDPRCKAALTGCLSRYSCKSSMLDSMKKHCDGTHCIDVWCCKKGCCGCDGNQWASAKQGSWLFNCGIRLCYNFTTNPNPCAVFLHEVSHCAGTDDMDEENQDGCNAQNLEICMRDYVC
ncbi:MAG: hypothetical protein HND43_07230 [Armatimonadetes bacterium]|nr:hypothetical protein [Armatimonadota bacterium]NOG39171.1 hypothetical protein [Armatimonadota bacterium]